MQYYKQILSNNQNETQHSEVMLLQTNQKGCTSISVRISPVDKVFTLQRNDETELWVWQLRAWHIYLLFTILLKC